MFKRKLNLEKDKEENKSEIKESDVVFKNLAPTDNVEININTEKAIEYAFNDKDVKNIGITGIYSAGKSSIIKTYLKKNNIDNESLIISLAKFEKSQNEDISEVEKEIIEKLYYSKGAHPTLALIKNIFLECIIGIGILFFIYISNYERIDNLWQLRKIPLIISALVIFIILFILLSLISKVYSRYSLKFNIGNINLEIKDNKDRESILNKYIDFIVKIVKDKKYKNFIFEDIDRFNNSKLLLNRLRDLNATLNEIDNIKFIYEIKDGEFNNNTRTKFFDFIVPIVPYISFGTSDSLLNQIIKENNLEAELSKEFISDVCLFINDPRLLINMFNEYLIYKDSINNSEISSNNLFVYIIYKNIFPDDFGELQDGCGNLYNFLKCKKEIANNINRDIQERSLAIPSDVPQNYKNLIDYFVKEDLFDENYESYISRFYSGSITKDENAYLTRIKRNLKPEIDFEIKNINIFTKKLFNKDYKRESCINIYIFNELLKDIENRQLIDIYKNTIINSNYYVQMLYKICTTKNINKESGLSEFVKIDNLVIDKIQNSQLQENEKIEILKQIIINGSIEELKKLVNIKDTIKYMGDNNLLIEVEEKELIKLEKLNIKYKKIL